MAQLFANNASATLASNITSVATTLTVSAGAGALFPSPTGGNYFLITMVGVASGVETSWEIIKVTARSTDTLTIVRAQESTTAYAWTAGTKIELRLTAGSMNTGGINSIIPITSPVDTAINILSGELGLSFEPILINATGSITISSGQQWVIWPPKAASAVTQNATTVSINETIANGFNGSSIGPITISSGRTLSVASGQRYIIF